MWSFWYQCSLDSHLAFAAAASKVALLFEVFGHHLPTFEEGQQISKKARVMTWMMVLKYCFIFQYYKI